MLNTELTSKTSIPHCYGIPETKIKSHSPYGLPIVDNCVNCKLKNSNFFCSLAPEAMSAFNRIKHVSSYPEGAMVFLEGQPARGVYLLCQGRVKLMTANSEGKTLILKIGEPGEVLGLQSVGTGTSSWRTTCPSSCSPGCGPLASIPIPLSASTWGRRI